MKIKTSSIFLLKNTPLNVLATHAFARESILRILQHITFIENDLLPGYTILIHREEDLHAFVRQIPELAWEMLEYADEPLELLYPKKKFVPPFNDNNFISIRLVKQDKLGQIVRKYGPLITFPLGSEASYPGELVNEEINCSDKQSPYKRVKTMKLFEDGTFTFLR